MSNYPAYQKINEQLLSAGGRNAHTLTVGEFLELTPFWASSPISGAAWVFMAPSREKAEELLGDWNRYHSYSGPDEEYSVEPHYRPYDPAVTPLHMLRQQYVVNPGNAKTWNRP